MMTDHTGDYSEMLFDDVYDILTKEDISWPLVFSEKNKQDLIDRLIEYFLRHEDYGKVQKLEELKENLKGD